MLLDHEIAEERSVGHLDLKVLAPEGKFVRVTHVYKTVPMEVWRLETRHLSLECAAKHIVVTTNFGLLPVDQVREGDLVETESGPQEVVSVENLRETRELYDLRVESDDHLYFTGGILSHNSTGLCSSELFKFNLLRNYRSIYLTPLKEHAKTIADTLLNLQRGSIYPPDYYTARGYRNNMYYKESPKGGTFKLLHILTDPTKIRGNSVPTVIVDEAQDFDPEHLPEIEQVQKAFRRNRMTVFAGTSKDLDTCLESQYRLGSMGVWHIPCTCKDKFHSMDPDDPEVIKGMLTVSGLRCPHNHSHRLDPMEGEFVHGNPSRLEVNMPSFHLPQIIVPEYAQAGPAFADIWKDFKRYSFKKFLNEVWGIAIDAGMTELTERDLMNCCTDKTFAQTQADYLSGKTRYVKVFSGLDWGGSDHEPAYRSKLSYTVHTIWGMKSDGHMDLIYAYRYSGMNYREIAGHIVENHLKYKAFAMGTDNGGGAYYNAYMRDCGRIPSNLIVHFQYTDTRLMLDRIPHPEANIMSLHRTDSISALLADIKDRKLSWPRWDDSSGFVLDCLNVRRNITEAPSGRTIMRYLKPGSKADDFMMSTNYACMMKRIITRESLIPNRQILEELAVLFGDRVIPAGMTNALDMFEGGYVSG
jgi:hypothetical protein